MRDVEESAIMRKLSTMTNEELLDLIGTVIGIPLGVYYAITEVPTYQINSQISRIFLEISTPLLSSALFSFMFSKLGKTIDFFSNKRTLITFWHAKREERRLQLLDDLDLLEAQPQTNKKPTKPYNKRLLLKHVNHPSSESSDEIIEGSRQSTELVDMRCGQEHRVVDSYELDNLMHGSSAEHKSYQNEVNCIFSKNDTGGIFAKLEESSESFEIVTMGSDEVISANSNYRSNNDNNSPSPREGYRPL